MINLLNRSENRRLSFIESLANTNDFLTLSDLSQELNCSIRVLQDDISFFEQNFTDFQVQTSNDGVRLSFEKGKNLESIYQKILSDSIAYQLLETVFLYEGKTIPELAVVLDVSVPTVYRLIKQINAETRIYDYEIKTNPCRVVGKEENIRFYYYQYFREKYSYLNGQYKIIDEKALDRLLHFFIDFTKIPVDFAFYNIFKLVTSINLIRYKKDHKVDTRGIAINFDEIIPNLSAYDNVFKDFEEKLNVKMSKELINQMFTPYIQEGFSLNYNRLLEKAEKDKKLADAIDYLEGILKQISEKTTIPLKNTKEVIFALNNASHLEYQEPQSGYILYNRNQYFAEGIRKNFPQFYESFYQGMKKYRKFLGKPMTEDGTNFFIYTAFIFWEDLVPELLKRFKQIHVIVISEQHVTHGHMIKDFIESEFSEQIMTSIYTNTELNKDILENLDCDLIVTSFPISKIDNKETIYIENIPTQNDLKKIQKAISVINSKHNIVSGR